MNNECGATLSKNRHTNRYTRVWGVSVAWRFSLKGNRHTPHSCLTIPPTECRRRGVESATLDPLGSISRAWGGAS
jgi:hypothetical protein